MNTNTRAPWPFAPVPALVEKNKADVEVVAGEDIDQAEPEVEKKTTVQRRKMTDADIRMVAELHAQGLPPKEIARQMGRSYATVFKAVARIKNEVVSSESQQAPVCVDAAEAVMPLVRNSNGVLESGYPHVLAEFLKNSMLISELYDKPEVLISRLVASEIIRVLEGGHEQL